MNIPYRFLSCIACVTALSACASRPPAGTPEYDVYVRDEQKRETAELVEQTIDSAPAWYKKPTAKPGYWVAAGTDRSTDMQFALDKAMLSAKSSLAAQVKSAVTSTIKSFVAESGDPSAPSLEREIEKVAKDVVAEVALTGHHIVNHEIIREGTYYRAYVLIDMPIRESKPAVIANGNASNVLQSRLRASKAFQELEAEIGKQRQAQ